MAVDFSPILNGVLQNPVSMGILTKFLGDVVKGQLKNLDSSGALVKNKAVVQPIVFVLSAIVAVLSAAMEGNAASYDPSSFLSFLTMTYLSAVGADQTLKGGKAAVAAVAKK